MTGPGRTVRSIGEQMETPLKIVADEDRLYVEADYVEFLDHHLNVLITRCFSLRAEVRAERERRELAEAALKRLQAKRNRRKRRE